MTAQTADVTVSDYLARRRPLPHLVDLSPETDPAAFQPGHAELPTAAVYATIRSRGEKQTDIRLLVDDGERHTGLAAALARNLGCDVYLTPEGAYIRYIRESSSLTGESWDAIAVDRVTGGAADWLVLRPEGLAPDVPTWFTTIRGRLRLSSGLVTVTLPDGLAFATKGTFRDTTYLATHMRPSSSRVSTVAVNADLGRFEIRRFDDTGSLLGGVEFATLVAASLDVIQPDVQLALTWPTDAAACTALDVELMRFADALNRTVWVPQPQGAAFALPGCGEFAAVDEVGGPSVWRAYPSRLAAEWEPRYGTDLDGRLVPRGELVAAAFPGVHLVSVPAHQLERFRPWYESVAPLTDLFALDLSVLADGRLGVLLEDGRPVAVGPRELRTMLRAAGWTGEDLLLLTRPPAAYWPAAITHLQGLADHLTADVWLPARGAEVWAQADGTLAAAPGSPGDRPWHLVRYARKGGLAGPDDPVLPAALTTAAQAPSRALAPAPGPSVAEVEVRPALDPPPAPARPVVEGVVEPVAVTLARIQGSTGSHAIVWLPPTPVVNRHPIDLYLWIPRTSDDIEAWGLPSADLFLLAGQDPLRITECRHDGYLLRVEAPAETAVELAEHLRHAPAAMRERLLDTGGTHLLPLAWLAELRVTARFDLDGRGGIAARHDAAASLAIRFEGADHGIPGLPNDVVRWPGPGERTGVPSYLMLPDDPEPIRHAVHRGFVPLTRRRPALVERHALLEVKVRKRKAIDIPATLDNLGGVPVVGRMHDFVGLDLLLPADDLDKAAVSRIWRAVPSGKPALERVTGASLADALALTGSTVD